MLNNYLTIYKKFVLKIVVYLVYNMNREEDCFFFFSAPGWEGCSPFTLARKKWNKNRQISQNVHSNISFSLVPTLHSLTKWKKKKMRFDAFNSNKQHHNVYEIKHNDQNYNMIWCYKKIDSTKWWLTKVLISLS